MRFLSAREQPSCHLLHRDPQKGVTRSRCKQPAIAARVAGQKALIVAELNQPLLAFPRICLGNSEACMHSFTHLQDNEPPHLA